MASDNDSEGISNLSELDSGQFDEDLFIEATPISSSANSSNKSSIALSAQRKRQKKKGKLLSMVWQHFRARLPHEPA